MSKAFTRENDADDEDGDDDAGLHRLLGDAAMEALERLMGLILTAIAVEMLLGGIREFVKGLGS